MLAACTDTNSIRITSLPLSSSLQVAFQKVDRQCDTTLKSVADRFAGYDEGGFSAAVTLASFKNDFDLNSSHWKNDATGLANRTANITSFGVLGAAFGSIIALALTDRIGRLRCWRLFILLWASGILMQVFSSGIYGFMLFARIWGGLGSGGLTVVAPLYLSEIAPANSRGMIVSMYMVQLLTWLSFGKLHVSG